jgi:hypothetical protein
MGCDEHNQDKGEKKRGTRGRESRMTRDRRTDGETEETKSTPNETTPWGCRRVERIDFPALNPPNARARGIGDI